MYFGEEERLQQLDQLRKDYASKKIKIKEYEAKLKVLNHGWQHLSDVVQKGDERSKKIFARVEKLLSGCFNDSCQGEREKKTILTKTIAKKRRREHVINLAGGLSLKDNIILPATQAIRAPEQKRREESEPKKGCCGHQRQGKQKLETVVNPFNNSGHKSSPKV